VAGTGVDSEVIALLASPGTDTVRDDSPVSVYVEGMATRGARRKRFAWPFRAEISYETCRLVASDGHAQLLPLRSGQRLALELVFDSGALFRDDDQLRFDRFAAADDAGDSDGAITLAELATDSSHFEQLYFTRLPALVQLPMGSCSHRVNAADED
jgi:hypothetical protein